MKKLIEKFKELSVSRRVQLVAALVVTIALLIAIPVVAWFSYRREAIKLMKVDSPNVLYLSAAHREDTMCFEIDGINADELQVDNYGDNIIENGVEQKITHKDYVFCVTGESVDEFTLQLAYTTNNPFTYEVFAAVEYDQDEFDALPAATHGVEKDYVRYDVSGNQIPGVPTVTSDTTHNYHTDARDGDYLYYKIDTTVNEGNGTSHVAGKYDGTYLNMTNESGSSTRKDATNTYHANTYTNYNNVNHDAEPIYWQATGISAFPGVTNVNKQTFSRHFILRISWPAGELDNTAKETDILYITVKATK